MLRFQGKGENLQEAAKISENPRLGSVCPLRFVPWSAPWVTLCCPYCFPRIWSGCVIWLSRTIDFLFLLLSTATAPHDEKLTMFLRLLPPLRSNAVAPLQVVLASCNYCQQTMIWGTEQGVITKRVLLRADFREGDEDSNLSIFRVRRFNEWPGPLHWMTFPVEILTKPLIHWIASPLFTQKPFFSLKSASSHPFPKIDSDLSLRGSLENLEYPDSTQSLANGQILYCFSHSGNSLETLKLSVL